MYSKQTESLQLPIFVPNDHPDWLTDWNGAMEKLDGYARSMEFITEPAFTDLVEKQVILIEDVKGLKARDDDFEQKFIEVGSSIDELKHGLMHEHERNDLQDGKISNLRDDLAETRESLNATNEALGFEVERAMSAEEALDDKIAAETERAELAENNLSDRITNEFERAKAVEEEIKSDIITLFANDTEHDNKIYELELRVSKEHQRNDEQDITIQELTEKTAENTANITQNHEDILELQKKVDDEGADFSEITERVSTLENELPAIKADITQNHEDILELQKKVGETGEPVDLTEITERVSLLETGLSATDDKVEVNSSAITKLQEDSATLDDIKSVEDRVYALEQSNGESNPFVLWDNCIIGNLWYKGMDDYIMYIYRYANGVWTIENDVEINHSITLSPGEKIRISISFQNVDLNNISWLDFDRYKYKVVSIYQRGFQGTLKFTGGYEANGGVKQYIGNELTPDMAPYTIAELEYSYGSGTYTTYISTDWLTPKVMLIREEK